MEMLFCTCSNMVMQHYYVRWKGFRFAPQQDKDTILTRLALCGLARCVNILLDVAHLL